MVNTRRASIFYCVLTAANEYTGDYKCAAIPFVLNLDEEVDIFSDLIKMGFEGSQISTKICETMTLLELHGTAPKPHNVPYESLITSLEALINGATSIEVSEAEALEIFDYVFANHIADNISLRVDNVGAHITF